MWANRYFAPRYFNDRYWGTSSGEDAVVTPDGLRHYPSRSRARYPLRILHGDKFYIVESVQEEQALIRALTEKPKKKAKKAKQKPIQVFTADEPQTPVLTLARIEPDTQLLALIREMEAERQRQADILADDEEFIQLLMMVI